MRRIEFKMERPGLLEVGQKITVTEGLLPSNYYYTIDPSLAMSPQYSFPLPLEEPGGCRGGYCGEFQRILRDGGI